MAVTETKSEAQDVEITRETRRQGAIAAATVGGWFSLQCYPIGIKMGEILAASLRQAKYIDLLPAYNGVAYPEGKARIENGGVTLDGEHIDTGKVSIVFRGRLVPEGADSIRTAALAIKQGLTNTELGEMIFPYLTTVEGLKPTAQAFGMDVSKLPCCAG